MCGKEPTGQRKSVEKESMEARTLEKIQEQLTKRFGSKEEIKEDEKQVASERPAQRSQRNPQIERKNPKNPVSAEQQGLLGHALESGPPPQSFAVELTHTQKEMWQKSVVDWLSRPSPLKHSEQNTAKLEGADNIQKNEEQPQKNAPSEKPLIVAKAVHRQDPRLEKLKEQENKQLKSASELEEADNIQKNEELPQKNAPSEKPLIVAKAVHRQDPRLEKLKKQENKQLKSASVPDFSSVEFSVEGVSKTLALLKTLEKQESVQPTGQSHSKVESKRSEATKTPGGQLSSVGDISSLNVSVESLRKMLEKSGNMPSGVKTTTEQEKEARLLAERGSASDIERGFNNLEKQRKDSVRDRLTGDGQQVSGRKARSLSAQAKGKDSESHPPSVQTRGKSSQASVAKTKGERSQPHSSSQRAITRAGSHYQETSLPFQKKDSMEAGNREQKMSLVGSSSRGYTATGIKSCPRPAALHDSTKKRGESRNKVREESLSPNRQKSSSIQQKGQLEKAFKEVKPRDVETENRKGNAAKSVVSRTKEIPTAKKLAGKVKGKSEKREVSGKPAKSQEEKQLSRVIDPPESRNKAKVAETVSRKIPTSTVESNAAVSSTNSISVVTSMGKYTGLPMVSVAVQSSYSPVSNVPPSVYHPPAMASVSSVPSNVSQGYHGPVATGPSMVVPSNIPQPAYQAPVVPSSFAVPTNIPQPGYHNPIVQGLPAVPLNISQPVYPPPVVPSSCSVPLNLTQAVYHNPVVPSASAVPSNLTQPGYHIPAGTPMPMANPPSIQRSPAVAYGYTPLSYNTQQPATNTISPGVAGPQRYPPMWPLEQFPVRPAAPVIGRTFSDPSGAHTNVLASVRQNIGATGPVLHPVQSPPQQFLPNAAFPITPWPPCPVWRGLSPTQGAMGTGWQPTPPLVPPTHLPPRQGPPFGFHPGQAQFRLPQPSVTGGLAFGRAEVSRRHSADSAVAVQTALPQKGNEEMAKKRISSPSSYASEQPRSWDTKSPADSNEKDLPQRTGRGCGDAFGTDNGFVTKVESKGSETVKDASGNLKHGALSAPDVNQSEVEKTNGKEEAAQEREVGEERGTSGEIRHGKDKGEEEL